MAPALVRGACTAAVLEALTLMLAGAVPPPTAPLKMALAALTVSAPAPLIVLPAPNTALPAAALTVVAAASVTGPVVLNEAAPLTV